MEVDGMVPWKSTFLYTPEERPLQNDVFVGAFSD